MASSSLRLCMSERLWSLQGVAWSLRGLGSSSVICRHFSTHDFSNDGSPPSGLHASESDKPQGFTDNAVVTQSLPFDVRLPDISHFSDAKPPSSTSFESLLPPTADLPSSSSILNGPPMENWEANVFRGVADVAFTPRGVYKAILLGEVGQSPVQKILKSGRAVTIFSVGTGGMHNNRRPFEGESPEEYAKRSYTQWHRVAVYQEKIGQLAMRNLEHGTQVYLEGNIETRIYNEPVHGAVKRIREIAIRQNGRLLFMDQVFSSSSFAATAPTINQESSFTAANTTINQNSYSAATTATIKQESLSSASAFYDDAFAAENAADVRESASS